MKKLAFIAGVSAMSVSASLATAADLDAISYGGNETLMQPVEVGSGWYLRGDINYAVSANVRETTTNGNNVWNNKFRLKNQVMPSIGIGYQFTDNLRGDLTAGYISQSAKGFDGSARVWDLMANAYYDIGNFGGFTPYLGGGLGMANVRYKATLDDDIKLKSDDTYRFAWALMAGVAIDVAPNVKVDLGYRYSDMQGDRIASGYGYTMKDKGIRSHQLRAGVRLNTW